MFTTFIIAFNTLTTLLSEPKFREEDDNEKIPERYLCPITKVIMVNPVKVGGHNYERYAIVRWFQEHDTNPMTNEPSSKQLYPNDILKEEIKAYLRKNCLYTRKEVVSEFRQNHLMFKKKIIAGCCDQCHSKIYLNDEVYTIINHPLFVRSSLRLQFCEENCFQEYRINFPKLEHLEFEKETVETIISPTILNNILIMVARHPWFLIDRSAPRKVEYVLRLLEEEQQGTLGFYGSYFLNDFRKYILH
jgi:hypothetical protein